MDAIRSAKESKDKAEYDKLIADLENQITDLEEKRDDVLAGYDDQIEKLDKIKDRWSSIVSDIEGAINAMKASELFGDDWKDKILSGNDDDIYNNMKDWYSSIATQKDQYEKQIESNERIANLMKDYAEQWVNGSLTFGQAVSSIDSLMNLMENGISSLENMDILVGNSGKEDLSSLLSGMKESVADSASQMKSYFDIVQANADVLNKYTLSWEAMQQNIKDQIAALEEAAKNIREASVSHSSGSSSGGGNSHNEPNTNDKSYVNGGPGRTDEGYNNAIKNGQEIRKYHNGGLVEKDTHSTWQRKLLQKIYPGMDLDSNEVLAKLQAGEYVLTKDDQAKMAEKGRQIMLASLAPSINVTGTPKSKGVVQEKSTNINISVGNVNLPQVKNGEDFVKYMNDHIALDAMKRNSKNNFN